VALFLVRARLQRSGQGSGRPRGRQACHSAHKLLLRRLAEDAGGSGDRAAFPDMTTTLEHLIGEGDMVAVRHVWRATHQGPYEGIAPTGRPITFTGADIYRIVDGKIVEEWFGVRRTGDSAPARGGGRRS